MTFPGMDTDTMVRASILATREREEHFANLLHNDGKRATAAPLLRVGRFRPGGEGGYASCRAVFRHGLGPMPYVVWTVHLVDDKKGEAPRFEVANGHYATTFEAACELLRVLDTD